MCAGVLHLAPRALPHGVPQFYFINIPPFPELAMVDEVYVVFGSVSPANLQYGASFIVVNIPSPPGGEDVLRF